MSFSFHANTLAFGGQFEEPGIKGLKSKYLPSQASVTLPPQGGFGESAVSKFCDEDVSFFRAESRVFGNSFQNKLFKTYANVTVYGLDIAGIVQADVLSASITSINQRVADCTSESRISFDAKIVGLVIAGVPYDVALDTGPFLQYGTFSEFTDSFTRMSDAEVQAAADAYNWPIEECKTVTLKGETIFHVPARCSNGLRATILRKITPSLADGPALKQQGFTIEVPNLGLVHLAEVLLTVGRREINLMRVELNKTLGSALEDVSQEPNSDELRPHALALAPLANPLASGGYAVAHAVGNGTDFGPP